MKRYNGAAFNQFPDDANGIAYAYAKITVRDSVTGAKAQLYGENGSNPISNPVTADGQGYYFFYVEDGRYDLVINEGGDRQRAVLDEAIFDDGSEVSTSDDYNVFEVIAHRGFKFCYPQNTMLAFTSAIRSGGDSLECDVQFSSDGVAYVFHDSNVSALTNGSGNFNSLTSSYIDSLLISEAQGTFLEGVGIPRFSTLLQYCRETNLKLYPEIKGYRTSADISIFVDLINQYDMQDDVVVASFNFSDIEAVRALSSRIAIGFLGSSGNPAVYEEAIDKLSVLGNGWIFWNYPALLTYPSIRIYAESLNVKIAAWTVNNNRDAQKLVSIGINKIITDVPLEIL